MDGTRALRGRIGAFVTHSRYDPRHTTANARAAFLARFETEVDPDQTLSTTERTRRALMARKAYFARLAYRSALARSQKKSATATSGDALEVDRDFTTTPHRQAS